MTAQRRLVAVVVADVVGYSRLMERDETGTHHRLRTLHDDLIAPKLVDHGGRLVRTAGDGMLVEFRSATSALRCMVEIQREMGARNLYLAPNTKLQFRVGINLGDIIVEGDDIFGDGVNVAARLETLAEPGGICVSAALREQVHDDLGIEFVDAGEQHVKNISKAVRVFHVGLGKGLDSNSETSPAGEPLARDLPHPLTSFIGREHDIAACVKLLEAARLVTLTGIGGCGKTRLAISVAEQLLVPFAGDVYFVDLVPIAEPERVALSVATALGVREEPDRPIDETLVRQLAGRRALLVLDNCEHLLGECAALAERLLLAAPGLRVLATSREGLGVPGERVFGVRSLSIPTADSDDIESVQKSESIRLFVERATQVVPQFCLDSENVVAAVEICRRLDGIPLALELAAARLKILSIDQIRAKLNDRFALLGGRPRAISRHTTLLATLEWSYDHLTPDEQRWLRLLCVFPGGATLEAAVAVAGEKPDEIEALGRLERLVDLSLLVVERNAPAEPRYGMLETVRQYAQDRLIELDEVDEARGRHLAHFLAFAKRAQSNLFGKDMKAWLDKVNDELPNLLAAHAWCDHDREGAEKGLELAANLRTYWLARGLFALGQRVYEEALSRPGIDARSMLLGRALYALGQHQYVRGRLTAVLEPTRRALAIAREHGDDELTVYCLDRVSLALLWLGEIAQAADCADEEMAVAQKTGNRRLIGFAFTARGAVCRATGDLAGAADGYERALTLFDGEHDLNNRHNALVDIARVSISSGALDRAREALRAAINLVSSTGTMYRGHFALEVASLLASASGEWRRAACFQGAADAAVDKVGGMRTWFDDRVLAELRERPRLMLGSDGYDAAYTAGRELTLATALASASAWLDSREFRGATADDHSPV